jgi:Bifunctional DNA primase/polymerase, N-terminal/Primase C terminal 1 (PriCT-1)
MTSYPTPDFSPTTPLDSHTKGAERSERLRKSLEYAERGWPVFPCMPGGKKPLTRHGHLDATTDRSRITAWWNRWPDANIGIPTGEGSGILALDVDQRAGLDALKAEHGELPATRTHSTGSGGMHYLLAYPAGAEIRNSAGKLSKGLDVRGEGGYIVVPPSATTRLYELLDDLPLAAPPEWLTEALRQPHSAATPRSDATGGVDRPPSPGPIDLDRSGPIPAGTRDDTLTRIAGRLHDGTRDAAELAGALLEVNRRRCEPPLPDAQVEKIAASIHCRPPCKKSARVTADVLRELDALTAATESHEWDCVRNERRASVGGHTDRDLYIALLRIARKHGERIAAGVRVSVSVRALAEDAAIGSTRTVVNALDRLRVEHGLIRRDGTGSGPKAGALVLLSATNARGNTHPPGGGMQDELLSSVSPSVPQLSAERLRWSAPCHGGRLGKIRGRVIDLLEAAGAMTLDQLARAMNRRPYDLRTRMLPPLLTSGVVECSAGKYHLTADWRFALDRRREEDGEPAAARLQKLRHEKEQEGFREAWRRGEVVSRAEFGRRRRNRDRIRPEERHVSGTISELEKVEDASPELVEALAASLDRHPRRRQEMSSWLAVALWADELVDDKPTPEAVEVALYELWRAA